MTTSGTANDNEWYNKWQRVAQRMKANESDFRFQNETIMQCMFTLYSSTFSFKYNVKQRLLKQPPEVFYKKAALKTFAVFTGKLKACNFIKNSVFPQVFSCEYCEIFKNTYFEEHP